MPKNKGKFQSQKASTPAPVEEVVSLTSRAFQFMRPHALKIGAVLGGVAAVLVAVSIYTWYSERREAGATRLFGEAMDILHAPVIPEGEEAPPAKPDDGPRFKSEQERAEAAIAKLSQIEAKYGSAKSAAQARLVRASLLYDLGRYDEAIGAYRKYIETTSEGRLRFVALEGIGYAQEAKALAQTDQKARDAGLNEAYRSFEQVQPDDKGYYRDYALYHQARVKAELGDKAGALALFKQVLEKFPTSPLRTEINNRVSLLEEEQGQSG